MPPKQARNGCVAHQPSMIVRARPRVWELFTFWRLSVLPQIAWQIGSVVVLSVGVVVAEEQWSGMF